MTIQGDAATEAAQQSDMAAIEALIAEARGRERIAERDGDNIVGRLRAYRTGLEEALKIVSRPRGW